MNKKLIAAFVRDLNRQRRDDNWVPSVSVALRNADREYADE